MQLLPKPQLLMVLESQFFFWKTSRDGVKVVQYPIKGVLHPWPILWLFMHFSQKLQHIGDK